MSSLQANERYQGYTPSVIFNGKVHQRIGPLLPETKERPKYAQLYVQDRIQESTIRFQNMNIPTSTTKLQKKRLETILEDVTEDLHEYNPFVKDFKQIMKLPDQELQRGKIVISAKCHPREEHERRYNEQINLNEVSILTNNKPHDLVLQKRGGGLQEIYDMNPKAMPLHFTLLFPYGTFG